MANAERIRLAQELHDGIAQDLVGVGYSLDLLLAAPQTPVDTRIQLRTLRFTITEIVEKVRREMFQLRQPLPLPLGQQIHTDALSICQGLALTLAISEVPLPDESEKAFEIGRISAELLRNVVMHARATSVHIGLSSDGDMINLQVSDDGRGGAEESASRHGLAGIQERAERISATFNLKSDASGTHACLRVPIV